MTDMQKVLIKTDRYNFVGVHTGDIGTIIRTAESYFVQPVYEVRVADKILIFSEDEVEVVKEDVV